MDSSVFSELFGTDRAQKIGDDASIEYNRSFAMDADGAPEIFYFTLSFGSGVAASILGNWLWSKLKEKPVRLLIEREEVELTPEGITRILKEKIEVGQRKME
ncbi:MAG: hypothetical protein HY558_03690 [Euryarchaeota archaeon]|nr:hypothetical protein [Euryarchaeota archaeon]